MPRRIESVLSDPRFRREVAVNEIAPPAALADIFTGAPPHDVQPPTPPMRPPVLEAVVLLHGRPSLLIRKDRFDCPTGRVGRRTDDAPRADQGRGCPRSAASMMTAPATGIPARAG